MKRYIFTIIVLLCGLTVYSQKTYLNTRFVKDKKILEKKVYKDIKKRDFYREQDTVRISFIYCFNDIDSTGFEINNNEYLDKITPYYQYFDYFIPLIFNGKFPTQKWLEYRGYALNKNDSLIALCNVNTYTIRLYTHSEVDDKEYVNLVKNVLTQNFDLCFYTCPNGLDFIWCVKGNETFIYKIKTGEMRSLQECYAKDLDILSKSDILGTKVDKSSEKYFIRFK